MKKTILILIKIILFIVGFNVCGTLLSASDTIINFVGLALYVFLIKFLVEEVIKLLKGIRKYLENKQ